MGRVKKCEKQTPKSLIKPLGRKADLISSNPRCTDTNRVATSYTWCVAAVTQLSLRLSYCQFPERIE